MRMIVPRRTVFIPLLLTTNFTLPSRNNVIIDNLRARPIQKRLSLRDDIVIKTAPPSPPVVLNAYLCYLYLNTYYHRATIVKL